MLYGLHMCSNDRTQSKDIPLLSQQFYSGNGSQPGTVLPFYVASRDYDAASGDFTLFIGGDSSKHGPEKEILPAGTYAKLEVQPKLGIMWGASIGAAKRWFYTQWLPARDYEAVNLEYELHRQKPSGKQVSVCILFAIRRKQGQ